MELFGQIVTSIMMVFVAIGATALIVRPSSRLGLEFKEGVLAIGHIFIPVAGVLVLFPFLVEFVNRVVAPVYVAVHADPAIAVGNFLAGDLGGYQLAREVSTSHGSWIMAFAISMMAGAAIIFWIPVGLALVKPRDRRYLALGMMSGLLAVPFGVLVTCLILMATGVPLRESVDTSGPGTRPFDLTPQELFINILPVVAVVVALALALRFFTETMVRVFLVFGRAIEVITIAAFALSVIEYFTGVFSSVFGGWTLDPFIADREDQFRALEIAGYIGIMLAGAFPMVYVMNKYLAGPLGRLGKVFGISPEGMSGFLAVSANPLAMYRVIHSMPNKDKVLVIAYSVCAACVIGDHLAFSANFQPNMLGALMIGKFVGGIVAVCLASVIVVRRLRSRGEFVDGEEPDTAAVDVDSGLDRGSDESGRRPETFRVAAWLTRRRRSPK